MGSVVHTDNARFICSGIPSCYLRINGLALSIRDLRCKKRAIGKIAIIQNDCLRVAGVYVPNYRSGARRNYNASNARLSRPAASQETVSSQNRRTSRSDKKPMQKSRSELPKRGTATTVDTSGAAKKSFGMSYYGRECEHTAASFTSLGGREGRIRHQTLQPLKENLIRKHFC